jgi:hypothetical protein
MADEAKACKIQGCKRSYRAKGYCQIHYRKWRQGELAKARFKTCNHGVNKLKKGEKKECLKPIFRSGLCSEHHGAKYGKKAETSES